MKIRPEDPDVRHTHLSAHDGHDAQALLSEISGSARWADVITLTGVAHPESSAALQGLKDMWFFQGEHDRPCEAAVGWGPAWDLVHGDTPSLVVEGGQRLCATTTLLQRFRSSERILVSVSRMPDEVVGLPLSRKILYYQRTMLAWKRHITRLTDEERPTGVMVVADWNLDITRAWVRNWVRLAWPELRTTVRPNPVYKVGGEVLGTSANGRMTDWTLSDLQVVIPAHVRSDPEHFMHRPYVEGLAFPA